MRDASNWGRVSLYHKVSQRSTKDLFEVQLHPQVAALKSQLFIEAVSVFSGEVGCQLDYMRSALAGSFDCPFHHLAPNSKISTFFIYAHRLDLGSQASLKADRWQEHQVQGSDHLPVRFRHDQLMVWIPCNLLECRSIGLRKWLFIFFTLAPQFIICQQTDNGW